MLHMAGSDGEGEIFCNCFQQRQDGLPSRRASDRAMSVGVEVGHEDESSAHVYAWCRKGRISVALCRFNGAENRLADLCSVGQIVL